MAQPNRGYRSAQPPANGYESFGFTGQMGFSRCVEDRFSLSFFLKLDRSFLANRPQQACREAGKRLFKKGIFLPFPVRFL
jgi:hypothetical protein